VEIARDLRSNDDGPKLKFSNEKLSFQDQATVFNSLSKNVRDIYDDVKRFTFEAKRFCKDKALARSLSL